MLELRIKLTIMLLIIDKYLFNVSLLINLLIITNN